MLGWLPRGVRPPRGCSECGMGRGEAQDLVGHTLELDSQIEPNLEGETGRALTAFPPGASMETLILKAEFQQALLKLLKSRKPSCYHSSKSPRKLNPQQR